MTCDGITLWRQALRSIALASVLLACIVSVALAQTYPDRPVHVLVGYAAGSGPDIQARLVSQALSTALGQSLVGSRGSFAPGDRSPAAGHFQFQSNKLIGVTPWSMGARQISVSFDDGYTSCTTSIIEGHTAGGHIVRKGENGGTYEILSSTTSSPLCSIQNGNAFAN